MKICFICQANVCRSFISQELLKKFISDAKRKDFDVISRGIFVLSEYSVPQKIKDFLSKNDIKYNGHTPTQYSKHDLQTSDLILVMTKEQLELINDNYAQFSDKMYLFLKYCYGTDKDLEDPINKNGSKFSAIADKIKEAVIETAKKLKIIVHA